MGSQTQPKQLSDLVKREWDNAYCRKMVQLDASVSTEIGTPLDQNGSTGKGGLITSGNEADCDAIALQKITGAAATYPYCLCLVRGPVLIDKEELELEDSVTLSSLVAALEALGIGCLSEPPYTQGN